MSYRPLGIAESRWEVVKEFVTSHLGRLNVGIATLRPLLATMARLAAWCVDEHIPLNIDDVLDPDTVERFCAEGLHGTDSSISTARSHLRRLGPVLTTTAPWEPPPVAYVRPRLPEPYTDAELRCIERDINRQATPARCTAAEAVVVLGLGAGLDGRWYTKICGRDIRVADDVVVVLVPEPHARQVVVRASYVERLLALKDAAGDKPLVGCKVDHRNAARNIAARTVIDQGRLSFDPGRFRSTWMVAHMAQFPVFLQAAGLAGFGTLGDLLPFVDPVPDAIARQQLRDA